MRVGIEASIDDDLLEGFAGLELVRIPAEPIVIPSEIETVLNSIGVPPAARMPLFTDAARSRR